MSEQTPKDRGGLGDLLGKAKEFMTEERIDKAKEFVTDERIDEVAGKIKSVAPDSVDRHVDTLAEKAKKAND
ncbi:MULTISPECIES: hypothetical protein [Cellulosimicrobium]|uniref:hypothetical protein n=1 Tax=Cellulosimicrobium TaxID=157920 RepID=UPI0039EA6489